MLCTKSVKQLKKKTKQIFKQFKIGLLLSQENSESFTWYKYFTGREAKSVHNRKISKPKVVTKLGCQPLQLSLQSRTDAARGCVMLPGNLHSLQGGSSTASWLDCSWLAGKPEGRVDMNKARALFPIRVSMAGKSGPFKFQLRGNGCWVYRNIERSISLYIGVPAKFLESYDCSLSTQGGTLDSWFSFGCCPRLIHTELWAGRWVLLTPDSCPVGEVH